MKKYFIIATTLAMLSCTGQNDRKNDTSKTAEDEQVNATQSAAIAQNKSYCFLRVEGVDYQDTTTVHLIVNEGSVKGEMNWIPKEKDSRKGTLSGTLSDQEIIAVWHYMQEGMSDSMTVAFKLLPQKLAQKPLRVDTATGRQETDKDADYTWLYTLHDCGK